MKKLLSVLLALTLTLSLCSAAFAESYELALVTDVGTIDDKSFNQSAWEGLVKYAEENGISHKYYQPEEVSDESYLDSISLAVEGGAKIVVTPGYLFEPAIFTAQDMYPDVNFILIDGTPHDAAYTEYRTNENVVGVLFKEQESGFLAGYSLVKDGFTKLGFMGGMAVPAVIRFGYGFVQGAEAAAKELGLAEVHIDYHYTGGFVATPEAQSLAASWYNSGTEVIFACGGAVGNSVMAAAEASEGKFAVGVDKDQATESETVITSAMKGVDVAVYDAITMYYNDEFPGGQTLNLGASEFGVQLPMETSKFRTFSVEDYEAVFAKLVAGEYEIVGDTDVTDVLELPVEIVGIASYK